MKTYYFLVGAPRSGNTVISSVLNQNRKICLTAQSPLCVTLYSLDKGKNEGSVGKILGNFPDNKSYNNIIKNLFDNYYADWEQEIIFDRSPWGNTSNLKLLEKYFDFEFKFLLIRRSLVEIFASYMKWCEENPNNFINEGTSCGSVDEKYEYLFKSDGNIARNMRSISDVRKSQYFYHEIFYDDFLTKPEETVRNFYNAFGIDEYEHDFNNISQLKTNGIKYDDDIYGNNMHKLRSTLEKCEYDVDKYVPSHLVERIEALERTLF